MRTPGIHTATHEFFGLSSCVETEVAPGKYVPARPEPYWGMFQRWRAAWLVLTGRADALKWIDQ